MSDIFTDIRYLKNQYLKIRKLKRIKILQQVVGTISENPSPYLTAVKGVSKATAKSVNKVLCKAEQIHSLTLKK